MRFRNSGRWWLICLLGSPFVAAADRSVDRPPNIVVIVVDDLGWRDLGCQGSTYYSIIRRGDWKLIRFYDPPTEQLYQLAQDLGETNDLAVAEPVQRAELGELLSRHLREIAALVPRPAEPRETAK